MSKKIALHFECRIVGSFTCRFIRNLFFCGLMSLFVEPIARWGKQAVLENARSYLRLMDGDTKKVIYMAKAKDKSESHSVLKMLLDIEFNKNYMIQEQRLSKSARGGSLASIWY